MSFSTPAGPKTDRWLLTPILLSVVVVVVGAVVILTHYVLSLEVDNIERGKADPTCTPVSPTLRGFEIPLRSTGEESFIEIVELIEPVGMSIVRASVVESDIEAGSSSANWIEAGDTGVTLDARLSGSQKLLVLVEMDRSEASARGILFRTRGDAPTEEQVAMVMTSVGPACTVSFDE